MSDPVHSSLTDRSRQIAASMAAPLRTFLVEVGKRGAPRLSFEVQAASSLAAIAQHDDLCLVGERCEVRPVGQVIDLDAMRRVGAL